MKLTPASARRRRTAASTSGGERKPPSGGPKTKPSPIAAPSRPMPAARVVSSVTSATYACAAVMLAPHTPAKPRATTSQPNDGASA